MGKRVCSGPGSTKRCPTGALIEPGKPRCPACAQVKDRERGTPAERGYDAAHKRLREMWRPKVEAGEVDCRRCGTKIPGQAPWDLGHPDRDCDKPTAPEHRRCNRATSGR